MKKLIRTGLITALAAAWQLGAAAAPLPRSTPEAQGVSATAMLQFVNALNQIDGLHGVVVVRHGQVITEGWWAPYDAEHQHVLYSLSKSFTSSAVGFAVAEGKLSIDDPVLKFFPDEAPANPSDNLKAMRVHDLLMMSTGHQDEPPTAPDKVSPESFLAWPVPHLPGTHFKYNTAASFMLSAIVQKVTGQTELEYLRPRLFEPLGIEHPVWDTNFRAFASAATACACAPKTLRSSDCSICNAANGRTGNSSRNPGSPWPPRAKPPTAATRTAIGTRATASNSGAAGITPSAATAPSANIAS